MSSFVHLAKGITTHAWNKDRSSLAICPNSDEIWIYTGCRNQDSSKWNKEHVLKKHDMVISGLDWSPVTNMIVSCAHDRNAFVWMYNAAENTWNPSLVLLRINRAALAVKWSPDGKKFAVASGAKCVPVCYYEPHNNWWISKMIKKHKSTVVDIDWHPNSQLLVTGSSDFKCRVFSAFISDLDGSRQPGPFKELYPFGELMAEFESARGWVESVAWSPSGSRLAFTGHDSSLHVVHFGHPGEAPTVQSNRFRYLPLQRILMLSDYAIVGAGHDFNVLLFTADSSGYWLFSEMLEKKPVAASAKAPSGRFSAARSMWENKVNKGQDALASSSDKDSIWTTHECAISFMTPKENSSNGNITAFSTTALDGKLVEWKLSSLNLDMSKLRL